MFLRQLGIHRRLSGPAGSKAGLTRQASRFWSPLNILAVALSLLQVAFSKQHFHFIHAEAGIVSAHNPSCCTAGVVFTAPPEHSAA